MIDKKKSEKGSFANLEVYNSDLIIDHYANRSDLQKPEEMIWSQLKGRLSKARMLDIGVGAGRTTLHWAPCVAQYIGIDYSEGMIEKCRARFSGSKYENATFRVCDARSLAEFPDGYFDFIFFSFNGIDNLSHKERLLFFREARRLSGEKGLLCFSTHNVNPLLRVRMRGGPFAVLRKFLGSLCLWLTVMRNHYAVINGKEIGGLDLTYYAIAPKDQIKQLEDSGFGFIKVFGLEDGHEVPVGERLFSRQDGWLYYLCSC